MEQEQTKLQQPSKQLQPRRSERSYLMASEQSFMTLGLEMKLNFHLLAADQEKVTVLMENRAEDEINTQGLWLQLRRGGML